jgi:hypothetical protein
MWHDRSMPKRIRKTRRPKDINQLAHRLVELSTREESKPVSSSVSRIMAEMGRKGGRIGGKRRAERMTQEERSASASNAARVRWGKTRDGDGI